VGDNANTRTSGTVTPGECLETPEDRLFLPLIIAAGVAIGTLAPRLPQWLKGDSTEGKSAPLILIGKRRIDGFMPPVYDEA
jgi:hypothetical protein